MIEVSWVDRQDAGGCTACTEGSYYKVYRIKLGGGNLITEVRLCPPCWIELKRKLQATK